MGLLEQVARRAGSRARSNARAHRDQRPVVAAYGTARRTASATPYACASSTPARPSTRCICTASTSTSTAAATRRADTVFPPGSIAADGGHRAAGARPDVLADVEADAAGQLAVPLSRQRAPRAGRAARRHAGAAVRGTASRRESRAGDDGGPGDGHHRHRQEHRARSPAAANPASPAAGRARRCRAAPTPSRRSATRCTRERRATPAAAVPARSDDPPEARRTGQHHGREPAARADGRALARHRARELLRRRGRLLPARASGSRPRFRRADRSKRASRRRDRARSSITPTSTKCGSSRPACPARCSSSTIPETYDPEHDLRAADHRAATRRRARTSCCSTVRRRRRRGRCARVERYRLRFINVHTARPSMRMRLLRESTLLAWRGAGEGRHGSARRSERSTGRPKSRWATARPTTSNSFRPATGDYPLEVTNGGGAAAGVDAEDGEPPRNRTENPQIKRRARQQLCRRDLQNAPIRRQRAAIWAQPTTE